VPPERRLRAVVEEARGGSHGTEHGELHRDGCSLFDAAIALMLIQVRCNVAGLAALTLIPCGASSLAKATVIMLSALFDEL
jgi:hypothetical protein